MPRNQWSKEREKEYQELKEEFEEEGRYKGREEEVAARIVNKQRREYGETKEAKAEDKEGSSPDRGLPIKNYDNLTVDEILSKSKGLSASDLKEIESYEKKHKNRKTLLEQLDRMIGSKS